MLVRSILAVATAFTAQVAWAQTGTGSSGSSGTGSDQTGSGSYDTVGTGASGAASSASGQMGFDQAACQTELDKYCKKAEPKGEKADVKCLKKHEKHLSQACRDTIKKGMKGTGSGAKTSPGAGSSGELEGGGSGGRNTGGASGTITPTAPGSSSGGAMEQSPSGSGGTTGRVGGSSYQQPGSSSGTEFNSEACNADAERFCKDATTPASKVRCLDRHMAELSDTCRSSRVH